MSMKYFEKHGLRQGWWKVMIAKIGAAFLVSACASGPTLQVPVQGVRTEQIETIWLRAFTAGGGVGVSGMVRRTSMSHAPLHGHLHVAAYIKGRSEPIVVDTHWIGGLSGSRGHRMARFSALIPDVSPNTLVEVRISYRPARDKASPPP
jgi:hypothetical protein